ncbi:MAG: protein kinase, partial [Polyangiaceae bacterium]
ELSHPNIVPVYELGVEQGVYYIAMELCEGLTLSEVLAETGPLGPAEGAYVGAEICRALDYAHRRVNIVHRDITPRNVLIDDEGAVRIIDFGIAAPVTSGGEAARTEIFGSPGHMPPEQLHGADLSPATDVFAVGVLLIEAWTGYPPFRRATAQESELALFDVPAPIDLHRPELAPLRTLIASSVALDARDRPSAAEHLARPLREFLKSEDSGDIARRLGARVRRARRRSRASSPWLPGETGPGQTDSHTRPLHSEPPPGRDAANVVGSPVTRTFAAREDLEVWTRKLSSAPAPLPETPAATPYSGRLTQAPRDAAADDGGREPSGTSSSELRRAPGSSSGFAVVALCSVAFVVVAFAFGPRVRAPRGAAQTHLRPVALALVAPGESLAPPRALPVAAPAPSATPTRLSPQSAKIATQNGEQARSHGAVSDVSPEAEEFGALKVTADPRAAVELSGHHFHQLGQTPIIGLKLPTGRYQVVFRNDTFGTPVTTQVVVVAGGTRSVHADFRQAEPAVSVR